MRTTILVLSTLAFSAAIGVENASLLDFELKSLEEPAIHSLTMYEGKPLVMTFFQPECNWCAKQVRAINSLLEQCEIEAIAIGVRGSRSELRKELRRLRPAFSAYQASPQLIEELGGVPTTPITLIGDSAGGFVDWTRGYLTDDQLRALMQRTTGTACENPGVDHSI